MLGKLATKDKDCSVTASVFDCPPSWRLQSIWDYWCWPALGAGPPATVVAQRPHKQKGKPIASLALPFAGNGVAVVFWLPMAIPILHNLLGSLCLRFCKKCVAAAIKKGGCGGNPMRGNPRC